jgi:hypothetical protein
MINRWTKLLALALSVLASPVKAETSFLEAAQFFLTGADSDEVGEREIVLHKYQLVVYLIDDKRCVVRMRNEATHEIWQMNFCKLTWVQWASGTWTFRGQPDTFCGSAWDGSENFMDPDLSKTGKPVKCNFLGIAPLPDDTVAFDGAWDAYMFSTRKLSTPFRSQERLMASFKYIRQLQTGKPY